MLKMQTELEPTRFWKDTGQYIFILPDAQNKKKTTTGCKEDQIYFTRCLKIRTWVFFLLFYPCTLNTYTIDLVYLYETKPNY